MPWYFQPDAFQDDSIGPNTPGAPFVPQTTGKGFAQQFAATNSSIWGAGNQYNDLNTGFIGGIDTVLAGVDTFASPTSGTINLAQADIWDGMFRFPASLSLTGNLAISPSGTFATAHFNGFYFYENLATLNGFTISVTTSDGSVVLPGNTRGILFLIHGVDAPRIVSIGGASNFQAYPIGSVNTFFQSTAPAGWTQQTAAPFPSSMIQIITDSTGGQSGGNTAFSTVFTQTTTGGHTLATTELPSHTHNINFHGTINFYVKTGLTGAEGSLGSGGTTATTDGGGLGSGPHSHGCSLAVKFSNWLVAKRTG